MDAPGGEVGVALERIEQAQSDEERQKLVSDLLAETDNEPIAEDGPQPTQEPDLASVPRGGGVSPEVVLNVFRSQIGVTEAPPGSNQTTYNDWYGMPRQPWCAMFLSWCFDQAGLRLPAETAKGFAFTPSGAAWFKRQQRWTTAPAPGHVVFFQFPGAAGNRINHVGIVERVASDGQVVTIEGNTDESGGRTGGKVMRRGRRTRIAGYGIPPYGTAAAPAPVPAQAAAAPATTSRPAAAGDDWFEELLMNLPEIDFRGAVREPVRHPLVDNIQGLLLATRNPACDPGAVDGEGGQRTAEALENFQRMKGLAPDRVCGRDTWLALIAH